MHGYAERFDFDKQTLTGWVFDPEAADNRHVRVVALFDGDVLGEASPSGSRADLLKTTNQITTFSLRCSRRITALDVVSGRLIVKALSDGRDAALSLGDEGLASLTKAAVEELNGVSAPSYGLALSATR
ncbi:hypothetical protein [Microbacterium sp. NPDC087589]|uniref:hypothetical protein n=1 Tax=Microbacterium sp. NPDC087589 TaxID=3364191 RepID=UPI0037F551E2